MKGLFSPLIRSLVLTLAVPSFAQAQVTLFASNLGQASTGGVVVGNNEWDAQHFITGTNPGGYELDSLQLLMDKASGSPSGFEISIYSSLVNGTPGSSLGSLSGLDPVAGGVFTYASSSGIMLLPSSSYFVVATAATPVSQGVYEWSGAGSYTSSAGWAIDEDYARSTDGSSWTTAEGKIAFQMGISATAVPEPTILALAGLGLACMRYRR
ncbi:MAG TPA: choice-of-anchor R domain-containing protein [Candidatus Acidoferrales bacterium]|jgi:hypothetical protein|nr:choice-of-anchor R domain-containing protein [Candidatus Acidoferrales bacterium]